MTDRPQKAGGFLLVVAILAGFAIGATYGAPLFGSLAGLLAGTIAAILVWLKDRKVD